jgi:hypothetical protein
MMLITGVDDGDLDDPRTEVIAAGDRSTALVLVLGCHRERCTASTIHVYVDDTDDRAIVRLVAEDRLRCPVCGKLGLGLSRAATEEEFHRDRS